MKDTKEIRYDSADYEALMASSIPAALTGTPSMRFDSAEDASVFLLVSLITSSLRAMTLSIQSSPRCLSSRFLARLIPVPKPLPITATTRPAWQS